MLINTDDDFEDGDCHDNSEANNNIRNYRKVLKQSIKLPNQLLLKAKKVKAKFIYFLHQFVYFPLSVYNYYLQLKQMLDNDFIILK